jgi:hypothetical protein
MPPRKPQTSASSTGAPPPRLSQVAPSTSAGPSAATSASAESESSSVPDVSRSVEAPASGTSDVRATGTAAEGSQAVSLEQIRSLWPSVLDQIKYHSRVVWMMLVEAHPLSVEGGVIVASHQNWNS